MPKCLNCELEFRCNGNQYACSTRCKLLSSVKKDKNECWIWQRGLCGQYGKIHINMKTNLAHRISYEEFIGPIPAGLLVCHKCDVRLCINPEHLFLGTYANNMQDASRKNRLVKGEDSHFSRFTDLQVEELIKLREEGFTYERLARIFNCSYTYIQLVIKNKLRKGNKNGI